MRRKLIAASILFLTGSCVAFGQTVQCRPQQKDYFMGPDETIVGSGENAVNCPTVDATDPPQAPQTMGTTAAAPGANVGTSMARRAVTPFQVSFGYQYDSVNFSGYGSSTSRTNTNGAFIQGIGNISRYLSVVGNFDAIYKRIPFISIDASGNITQQSEGSYLLAYTSGVQVYPMGHRDWVPFTRAMFGAATFHTAIPYDPCSVNGTSCPTTLPITETGFAWQIGGGIDHRFRREGRLAFRLGQLDYGQMKKNGANINSLKFGVGLTF